MFKKTIAIRERLLGTTHPALASSLDGLAHLYEKKGDYLQAELLYKLALRSYEHNKESDHSDYAACASGYALLLQATNRVPEATEIASRAHLTLSQAKTASRM